MKVGDRVILLPNRWTPCTSNPDWIDYKVIGTVTRAVSGNGAWVKWDNGTNNDYHNGDLMLYSRRNVLWVEMSACMRDIDRIQEDIGKYL